MGVVSPLGCGVEATRKALLDGSRFLNPLELFPVPKGEPLPVGQVAILEQDERLPRTHRLARIAAAQAMAGKSESPDAIVMGVTTGGMAMTEIHLKKPHPHPGLFTHHAVCSVAEDIAALYHCRGPVITVSTACSSGGAAVKIALELIRNRKATRVLAGGADSLCRLTYYGFLSLQLIDPLGARPLDKNRRGMSVAEAAAMLLLVADEPERALGEILGGGLSCDAYHPAAPHPEGEGALAAMRAALADAGIDSGDIDYINLHGTGTVDNDRSEAKAIRALFSPRIPSLSSIKGASGHSLAAAGAVETVVSAMAIGQGFIPANTGCELPDPLLSIVPLREPLPAKVETVLSNSFGFGGNNAAVVIGGPGRSSRSETSIRKQVLSVIGSACITGRGGTEMTMDALRRGEACVGTATTETVAISRPPSDIRRLKRLPRLSLALADAALRDCEPFRNPAAVFFGTGWGALSETHDFLTRLHDTGEQFPSPTDFVGSVHNAPAGRVAMWCQARGPCVTATGGDYSFEQAVFTAGLCAPGDDDCFLVIGADENHKVLSPLFDRSLLSGGLPSDGGGAFLLSRSLTAGALQMELRFYESAGNHPEVMAKLLSALGGKKAMGERYGFIMAGIPGAERKTGEQQLESMLSGADFPNPVVDYRKWIGEFASASAVAAVVAMKCLQQGVLPGALRKGADLGLGSRGALIVGLGRFVTALEIMPG